MIFNVCTELREKILNVFLPQLHYTSRRETPYASILITGGRGSGKRRLVNSVGERLGLHVFEVNCKREILEGASDIIPMDFSFHSSRATCKNIDESYDIRREAFYVVWYW